MRDGTVVGYANPHGASNLTFWRRDGVNALGTAKVGRSMKPGYARIASLQIGRRESAIGSATVTPVSRL